jgi:RND family efflux transporter MFP subunit
MSRRRSACWLLAATCVSGLLAGCARDPDATADPAVHGAAAHPAAAPAADTSMPAAPPHQAPATLAGDPALETSLAPLHDVDVAARPAGVVVRLAVEEGDRVAEGASLAQIDDREARAALAEREAEASRTEAAWGRAQKLHQQTLISEEAWLDARAAWESARAQRDRAALDVEHCGVLAPFAGMVVQRRVQRGQMVKVGDPLFRIADPATLRAELLLPEAMLGSVRSGQPVTLTPTIGGKAVPARITRVVPIVDPASGTFRVTIDLDNRGARLPAGITVRADLGTAAARR